MIIVYQNEFQREILYPTLDQPPQINRLYAETQQTIDYVELSVILIGGKNI